MIKNELESNHQKVRILKDQVDELPLEWECIYIYIYIKVLETKGNSSFLCFQFHSSNHNYGCIFYDDLGKMNSNIARNHSKAH